MTVTTIDNLTSWQEKAIRWVSIHKSGAFATPQQDGGLFLYAYGIDWQGKPDIVRDYVEAGDSTTLRQLMGY